MTKHALRSAMAGAASLMAAAAAGPAMTEDQNRRQVEGTRIGIEIAGTTLTATLEDNAAARQFAALLPLTVTLKDYASTEKVSDLPETLDAGDAPDGYDPAVGDIAYFAPWGNLAIFYRDFGYSRGLLKLGEIDTGIEALARPAEARAVIRLLDR